MFSPPFVDDIVCEKLIAHSVRSSPQSSMALGLEEGVRKRVLFSSSGMSRLSTQHSSPTWSCESECTHHYTLKRPYCWVKKEKYAFICSKCVCWFVFPNRQFWISIDLWLSFVFVMLENYILSVGGGGTPGYGNGMTESGTFFDPGDFELAYQKAFDSIVLLGRVLVPFLFFSGKLWKRTEVTVNNELL